MSIPDGGSITTEAKARLLGLPITGRWSSRWVNTESASDPNEYTAYTLDELDTKINNEKGDIMTNEEIMTIVGVLAEEGLINEIEVSFTKLLKIAPKVRRALKELDE